MLENSYMKVAVIGNGKVGRAVFRELQNFREIDDLILVGRNAEACRAEVEDYYDAIPLRIDAPASIWGGGYELTKDADILIYCAGPSVNTGEDRLSLAKKNIEVMQEVFTEVDKYAPNAIVVVVSNPLDIITTAITKFTGRPASRVIGTGTLLDTARLIQFVSHSLELDPASVTGYVIGEHGNSSVTLESSIRILGMTLRDYITANFSADDLVKYNPAWKALSWEEMLNEAVRGAGYEIVRGKGYTSGGVAAAAARVVFDIINDSHYIYPVSRVLQGEYGVHGIAISVPCMLGRKGILSVQKISLTEEEQASFQKSVAIIHSICQENNILL